MYCFTAALPSKSQEEVISNGVSSSSTNNSSSSSTHNSSTSTHSSSSGNSSSSKKSNKDPDKDYNKHKNSSLDDYPYIEQSMPNKRLNVNDYEEENYVNDQHAKAYKANGVAKSATKLNSQKESVKKGKNINSKDTTATTTTFPNNKDDLIGR